MSSSLTLIVLGQAYFLGTLPNTPTIEPNQISIPSIAQQLPQNVPSRSDYTYTPGIGSHKFHANPTMWFEASLICLEEGGHLAIINSPAEANVIAKLFAEAGPNPESHSSDNAWIGIHDLTNQKGDFQTIHNESLVQAGYNEWHDPKSTGGATCGAVYKDGKLSWFYCSRKLAFFCELPSVQPYTPDNGAAGDIGQEVTWWTREVLKEKLANLSSIAGSGHEYQFV